MQTDRQPTTFGSGARPIPVSVEENALAWAVQQAARSLQLALDDARRAGLLAHVNVSEFREDGLPWSHPLVSAGIIPPDSGLPLTDGWTNAVLVEFRPKDLERWPGWQPIRLPVEARSEDEALAKAEAVIGVLLPKLAPLMEARVAMTSVAPPQEG